MAAAEASAPAPSLPSVPPSLPVAAAARGARLAMPRRCLACRRRRMRTNASTTPRMTAAPAPAAMGTMPPPPPPPSALAPAMTTLLAVAAADALTGDAEDEDVALRGEPDTDDVAVAEIDSLKKVLVDVSEGVAGDDEGLRSAVVENEASLGNKLDVADALPVPDGVMELVIPGAREFVIVVVMVGVSDEVGGTDDVIEGEEPVERDADGSGERVAASVGRAVSVAVFDPETPGASELVGVSVCVMGGDCDSDVVAETVFEAVVVDDGEAPTDRLAVIEGVPVAVCEPVPVDENDVLTVFDGVHVPVMDCVAVVEDEAPKLTVAVDVGDCVGDSDVDADCEGV